MRTRGCAGEHGVYTTHYSADRTTALDLLPTVADTYFRQAGAPMEATFQAKDSVAATPPFIQNGELYR